MAKCPFIDPNYMLDVDDPCPVCGMLGLVEDEDLCFGDVVDTGDELHQILGEALRNALSR